MLYDYKILDLMKAVEIEATNLRETAAYNGEMSDRGANALLEQLKWYKLGLEKAYPK